MAASPPGGSCDISFQASPELDANGAFVGQTLVLHATGVGITASCSNAALDGRTVTLDQVARLKLQSPGTVGGPTRITLSLGGTSTQAVGTMSGTVSCAAGVCTLELDYDVGNHRLHGTGHRTVTIVQNGGQTSFTADDDPDHYSWTGF